MTYLAVLPSLLCGLVLCGTDLRWRRVPRAVVAVGVMFQVVVFALPVISGGYAWPAVVNAAYGVLAGSIQFTLALARPGSLGFGDVTASILIGQAVGSFGINIFVLWWLVMGGGGLVWLRLWSRWPWLRSMCTARDPTMDSGGVPPDTPPKPPGSAPFVPVIVTAGIIAVALGPWIGGGSIT